MFFRGSRYEPVPTLQMPAPDGRTIRYKGIRYIGNGSAAVLRLHFEMSRTPLGDWDVTEVDIFRPLVPIQIRVSLGLGISEALINAYVREARQNNTSQPGRSTLDVVAMDATATIMNL